MHSSANSDHSPCGSKTKLFHIEFSDLHVSKEDPIKPWCDQLECQLFEAEYLDPFQRINLPTVAKNDLLLRIRSMTIRSHRDLVVWQKAIRLSVVIGELVKQFPADERFGLIEQVVRSARSVHANIAEGHGRGTRRDYLSFLSIANGSIEETDSHLEEAVARGIVSANRAREAMELVREVGRMLCVLRWRLKEGTKTRF